MTGNQNFQNLHEGFKEKAKKFFIIVQHPWNLVTHTRDVDLTCKEHGLLKTWQETQLEAVTGNYSKSEFNSISLYEAIKSHTEEFHNG